MTNPDVLATGSTTEELLELLKMEGEKRRKSIRMVVSLFGGMIGAYVVIWFIAGLLKGFDFGGLFSTLACMGGLIGVFSLSSGHKALVKRASQLQDPRVVPDLLEVMDSADPDVIKEVKEVLVTLLPQLEPEQGILFDSRQIRHLEGLTSDKDEALSSAAIRALGKVGDSGAIQTLEELKKNPPTPKAEGLALEAAGDLRLRLAGDAIQKASHPSASNHISH